MRQPSALSDLFASSVKNKLFMDAMSTCYQRSFFRKNESASRRFDVRAGRWLRAAGGREAIATSGDARRKASLAIRQGHSCPGRARSLREVARPDALSPWPPRGRQGLSEEACLRPSTARSCEFARSSRICASLGTVCPTSCARSLVLRPASSRRRNSATFGPRGARPGSRSRIGRLAVRSSASTSGRSVPPPLAHPIY